MCRRARPRFAGRPVRRQRDEVTRVALQGLRDDEVRHEREIIERYNTLRRQHNLED